MTLYTLCYEINEPLQLVILRKWHNFKTALVLAHSLPLPTHNAPQMYGQARETGYACLELYFVHKYIH